MIEYLRGLLLRTHDDHIIVDVGGIGYGLDVPRSTLERLPGLGDEVELHVSFQVREESMRLYGFSTLAERSVFEIFLAVSGIGPRTSLDILSTVSIGELVLAIRLGNVDVLVRVPGIGRKKAERLIVELKDRVDLFPEATFKPTEGAGTGLAGVAGEGKASLQDNAVAALQSLGLKPAVAARNVLLAMRSLDSENVTLEDVVKTALQMGR